TRSVNPTSPRSSATPSRPPATRRGSRWQRQTQLGRGVNPMKPHDRLCDLMRQGIATFQAPKGKKAPVERPIVACEDCLDWHPAGRHTADAATRKANRAARAAAAVDSP